VHVEEGKVDAMHGMLRRVVVAAAAAAAMAAWRWRSMWTVGTCGRACSTEAGGGMSVSVSSWEKFECPGYKTATHQASVADIWMRRGGTSSLIQVTNATNHSFSCTSQRHGTSQPERASTHAVLRRVTRKPPQLLDLDLDPHTSS
jgi:hypothetical protein